MSRLVDHCILSLPLESVLKFVIHPRTTISEPGLKVELTVKTNPSAKTYTWYFEEEAIVEADFYEGVTTDQLIIPKLVPRHKGVYKCVVTNESNERFTSKEATVEISKLTSVATLLVKLKKSRS